MNRAEKGNYIVDQLHTNDLPNSGLLGMRTLSVSCPPFPQMCDLPLEALRQLKRRNASYLQITWRLEVSRAGRSERLLLTFPHNLFISAEGFRDDDLFCDRLRLSSIAFPHGFIHIGVIL